MTRHHAHADERRSRVLANQTEGLDLFAVAQESIAKQNALEGHKAKNPELVMKLRVAARDAYARLDRPISTNDIRHVLDEEHYAGDKRVLGVAFGESYWTRVGTTQTSCEGATAARVGQSRGVISTYEPTHVVQQREQKVSA